MRLLDAELTATRAFLPGRSLQTYHAPAIAAAARAGQYVQAWLPDSTGVLRRPLVIDGYDRLRGELRVDVSATGPGGEWLARLHPGETLTLHGPLGQPFEVDPRSRHLLLIAAADHVTRVRALADEALEAGRRVVVLLGASDASRVYPSSLLPEEVEYVVATDDGSLGYHGAVTDLVPDYEAWADQAFAAGPPAVLEEMARLARGRDARLGVARLGRRPGGRTPASGSARARRRSWLQVSLGLELVCALGTCLGCVVTGPTASQRVCRDGPVFGFDQLAWDELG